MRRPGVPQTPRSNDSKDRGARPEPKNQAPDRAEARGRRTENREQEPAKRNLRVVPAEDGARESTSRKRRIGIPRLGRTRKDEPRREAKRASTSLPESKPSNSEPTAVVKKTRISSPRRYFTPKRASETFGAKKDTIELGERRAEIKSARRMAILMRILIALGALAVVAAIVWAVFFSPFFALTASKIEVTGLNDDVPESAVQEKLTPYVGVPLPRISMGSAQESIEGIVQVKSARVSRAWPDGLSVNITVREPIAAEKTDEGYNVLDGEGVVIRSTLEYPEGLALVELNTEAEEDRETAMTRVAKVHEALPAELRERVAVYVGNALTVEMRTTDGRLIKWGDESDSGLKAQVVMLLLDQRPAQVYDVSTPARPVTS